MDIFLVGLMIFGLRLVDVSLGTLRIVFLTRGDGWQAGLIGFLESLTWVFAVTFLGVTIERWMAMGTNVVRIVAPVDSPQAAPVLREHGFAVTVLNGEGLHGEVRLALTVVPRRRLRDVLKIVYAANPAAFVTFEQVRLPPSGYRSATSVRK